MPPINIDGTDVSGITIDGTDVTEVTVDGDVVFAPSAIPDSVVDSFEDQDFAEYTDNGSGEITTGTTFVTDGTYGMEISRNPVNDNIVSLEGDGLDYYPRPGDTWQYDIQFTASDVLVSHGFLLQNYNTSSNQSGFRFFVDPNNQRLLLQKDGGASTLGEQAVTINTGTQYRVEISIDGSNGEITCRLLDSGGTVLASVVATDADAADGGAYDQNYGIEWAQNDTGGDNSTTYIDGAIATTATGTGGGETTASITFASDTTDFNANTTQFRNMHPVGTDHILWVHHDRVQSIDVSSPESPSAVASYDIAENCGLGVRVTSDDYALIGNGSASVNGSNDEIIVLDVSDPTSLTEVASVSGDELWATHGIALGPNEDYLYCTGYRQDPNTNNYHFTAVDISTRTSPTIAGSITNMLQPHDVEVRSDGAYAFVSAHESYFYSVDVSDPANMSVVDSIDYTNLWNGAGARLSGNEDYFFMGAGESPGYLISIDVSDPTAVSEADRVGDDRPYRFRIDGDYLYGADPNSSTPEVMNLYDISDPTAMSLIDTAGTQRYIECEFHPDGGYLYGADADSTHLSVFEI